MSVKDVVLDMVGKGKECGNTVTTGTPQPIPSDGKAKWLGNGGGGFTHVGPGFATQATEGSATQTQSSSTGDQTKETPSTETQSSSPGIPTTEAPSTQETQAPATTTQATQAPTTSTQTEAFPLRWTPSAMPRRVVFARKLRLRRI
ncbi:unnamed protein product [Phytophthora lilii]|uniref:Unnamed protein product n=1 Tax=Phytophthora lilii TaxID=2077276 RepID=A0A9W6U944_9STRA|nr:unnamed protein product [Phytophthora lilii]